MSLQDEYVKGQTASVALAQSSACFSDTEMSQIQTDKQNIESSLTSEKGKLDVLQENIDSVAEEIGVVTEEVEELRRVLVTETFLNEIKENMNTVRKSIQDLDTLETSAVGGVCSAPGYYDKASCENASGPIGGSCSAQWYTDEQSCVAAGYYEGGGCSASGYYDKASCENAGYSYSVITGRQTSGTCSGGGSYTDESSCVNAGYYTGGGCSDPTYYDAYSCTQAGSYQEGGYCSNPYYSNQQTCESENFSWIEGGTFVSAGHTWTDPSFVSYGYTWDQPWYEELTEVTIPYGYTWKEPQWVNAGYSWTYTAYSPYGYTWKEASEVSTRENLTTSLENLAQEYEEKLSLRNTQMGSIKEKESTLDEANARLKDLVKDKIDIKEKIAKLDVELQGVEAKSSKGVCQAYETSCSDSLDNDSDLAVDCSDSDCNFDSYCAKTTVPTPGTSTSTVSSTTTPVQVQPPVSSKFNGIFATTVSLTNNVLLVNSRDIVPAMKNLKVQAAASSTNTQTLLDRMATIRAMINSNSKTTTDLKTALTQLQSENARTTDASLKTEITKLASSGLAFADSLNAYHTTLLKFLTGSIPTPDLDIELNQRIDDSTKKGGAYRALIASTNTALAAAIKNAETLALSQSSASNGVLRAASITPRPGEIDVAVVTDSILVNFVQDIISFNSITVSVKDSSGSEIKTAQSMKRNKVLEVFFLDTLNPDEIYRVSISGTFVEEATRDELTWSQTWSFATEKKDTTFIGGIIDFIDDLFGLGGDKKEAEAICDDGKDNDNNGVADCSDKACEDDDYCKKAVCGNNKIEKGEVCDDGNTENGDGCSSSCDIEENNKTTCDDADEDGYDDENPTVRCGCLDKDEDGKDDISGASCKITKGASCLICQYEIDYYKGYEDRFKNWCERLSGDKKIIETAIDGSEISECPKNTTNYEIVIAGHACAANYARLTNVMKNSLVGIRNNIYSLKPSERDAFGKKPLSINGKDYGCHSAGGLFTKDNNWYTSFSGVVNAVPGQFFKNTVNLTIIGNQTYGMGGIDKESTSIGRVRLSSEVSGAKSDISGGIPEEGDTGKINVLYSTCPAEGQSCLSPITPPEKEYRDPKTGIPYNVYKLSEPLRCGDSSNQEVYFCSVWVDSEKRFDPNGNYLGRNGRWMKDINGGMYNAYRQYPDAEYVWGE